MSVQVVQEVAIICDAPGCNASVRFNGLDLEAPEYKGWLINHIGDKDFCPRHTLYALRTPEPPQGESGA